MAVTSLQDLLDDGSLIAMDAGFRFGDVIGPGTPYGEGFGLRLSRHSVVFTGTGGEFVVRAHFIGSAASGPGSWMWGWNNVNGFPDEVCARAGALRAFGERYRIPELTTAEIPLATDALSTANRFAVVATLLGDRLPSYVADLGGGTIAVFLLEHPQLALAPLTTPRVMSVLQATAAEGHIRDWPRAVGQYAAFRGLTATPQPDGVLLSGTGIDDVQLTVDSDRRLTRISVTATANGVPEPVPPGTPPADPLDLRRPGVDYADLTTAESLDAAVAAGRVEWFPVVSPMFGGADGPENRLPGPAGVRTACDWIDRQIVVVLDRGGNVSLNVDVKYDDGSSRVPRSVQYDLGDAGVHTLLFW